MSRDKNDSSRMLLQAVLDRNLKSVKAALTAGANVNGPPERAFAPIVAAVITDNADMVNFLLEKGADPDRPVTKKVALPSFGNGTTTLGERALHLAARSGNTDIVRLLLKRARADPNAPDSTGRTPLLATCDSPGNYCVEVVPLLLEAGADPTVANKDGFIPLHFVAKKGHMDLMDMLYSRAPATLNRCTSNGMSPLVLACGDGRESMVSKLLSLGAMQPMRLDDIRVSPLDCAVFRGFVGVVRVLINAGGVRGLGGELALAHALRTAVRYCRARILQLLLAVDGEERRLWWANINIGGMHLLHFGAAYCSTAAVSILLEAGADERTHDSEGSIPLDVIGADLGRDGECQMDRGEEVATRRMLQRGPAYRARSWAWPSDEEADAGGSGDGDTAAAAAAAAAVLS
ncbi:unnamed protein product, partial [Laminaria digitata]